MPGCGCRRACVPFVVQGIILSATSKVLPTFRSPELVALRDRDYSVYVMDPLEDCYALASSSKMPTTGVAVGMGLMSWILAEAEDAVDAVTATGRIRRDTISGETVEVVIALQAVRFMFAREASAHFYHRLRHSPKSSIITALQAGQCRFQLLFPLRCPLICHHIRRQRRCSRHKHLTVSSRTCEVCPPLRQHLLLFSAILHT